MLSLLLFLLSRSGHAQVSKGNFILLTRGLQVQGMCANYDPFHLDTYSNANYTSIHWLWNSTPSAMGDPPGFPWSRWVAAETNLPPQGDENLYLSQLVSLQLSHEAGDEWELNDPVVRDRAVNWFNAIRNDWPDTILYLNSYGGQVGDAQLGDFITRARPDMICFDTYPWKTDGSGTSPGDTPIHWYGDIRRYREHARANNIPLATYPQTYHSVTDATRDPSPSELRLTHFAALAFNAKVLIDFTYNTGASSFFDNAAGGDNSPNALYDEKADCSIRARNLGKALVRLKPIDDVVFPDLHTTSMMFLRGRAPGGAINPIPIGFLADPEAPNGYTDWVSDRNDPWLRGWVVTNKAGIKNGGTNGDVVISWFKPLDETFDGPTYSNQIYFMVLNGLTAPDGTAADCLQEIKLNFANSFSALEMLDPLTGLVTTNTLPIVSTRRQLVLNLNGGDAALFKISNGAPFVGVPPITPRLSLAMQGGSPTLTLQGAIGSRYQLERADSVPNSNWTVLTNLVLPTSPYVLTDSSPPSNGRGFYRAVAIP